MNWDSKITWMGIFLLIGMIIGAIVFPGCSIAKADEPDEFRRCIHHCDTTWLPRWHECKKDSECKEKVEREDLRCLRECQGIR